MKHRLALFSIAIVSLSLQSLTAQQIKSRKQQMEILRREKVSRLWPEKQSQIALMVNKYVERGLMTDPSQGSNGFQPVILGGMRSGNGFTYGIGYKRSDLFRDSLAFRFTARGSVKKSFLFDFNLSLPKLETDRIFVDFYAKYENSPQMRFYGQGQNSLESNRTSYRLEDTELVFRAGYNIASYLRATGSVGGYFVHTGEGTRDPSIDVIFPGLRETAEFLTWGGDLQFDYRDNPSGPRSGGNYYVRYRRYHDEDKGRHNFSRVTAFFEQFIPYFNKTRVIALRVEASTAFSKSDQTVPFYLQPYLGGNNRLRGFEQYRFTDRTAFIAIAEHRWYVFSGLEAGIFVETGKVAPRNGHLNLNDLVWDGGLSLRFKLFDNFLMRVDNAFSSEGWRFIWTFGEVFGRTKRW